MSSYRERLSANADEFDGIISEILAKIESLEAIEAHLQWKQTEIERLQGEVERYKGLEISVMALLNAWAEAEEPVDVEYYIDGLRARYLQLQETPSDS